MLKVQLSKKIFGSSHAIIYDAICIFYYKQIEISLTQGDKTSVLVKLWHLTNYDSILSSQTNNDRPQWNSIERDQRWRNTFFEKSFNNFIPLNHLMSFFFIALKVLVYPKRSLPKQMIRCLADNKRLSLKILTWPSWFTNICCWL